jgi:ribosomal protein S18 acetylase RimI-like enzyme
MPARKSESKGKAKDTVRIRALTPDDMERVVAIDRVLSGRVRRGFYESRLRAALKEPDSFIYLGADTDGELAGFVMARILMGEFGADEPTAVLDAIGVEQGRHGSGLGRALMDRLHELLKRKKVAEVRSQLDWNNHALMRFLDKAGYHLAPRLVLFRDAAAPLD